MKQNKLLWLGIAAIAVILCYGISTFLRTSALVVGFQLAILVAGLSSLFAS